jgi:hypothetical protein
MGAVFLGVQHRRQLKLATGLTVLVAFFVRAEKVLKMPRRLWTEDEVKRAHALRAAGYPYNKIDKALGRHAGATQQRFEIAGYGSGNGVRSNPISEGLLAEREARDAPMSSIRPGWREAAVRALLR